MLTLVKRFDEIPFVNKFCIYKLDEPIGDDRYIVSQGEFSDFGLKHQGKKLIEDLSPYSYEGRFQTLREAYIFVQYAYAHITAGKYYHQSKMGKTISTEENDNFRKNDKAIMEMWNNLPKEK